MVVLVNAANAGGKDFVKFVEPVDELTHHIVVIGKGFFETEAVTACRIFFYINRYVFLFECVGVVLGVVGGNGAVVCCVGDESRRGVGFYLFIIAVGLIQLCNSVRAEPVVV